jgi:uncharacterized protein YgiM (DUF1202 family)
MERQHSSAALSKMKEWASLPLVPDGDSERYMGRITAILFALLIALVVTPAPAFAVDITPSDRVVTRVNVRAGPSVVEPVVGKLLPGETAELLSAMPNWYQIRLTNSVEGFASKSWTVEVTPTSVSNQIRIGTWNIKKLGHGSAKNYTLLASIIDQQFDLLTVIEVMQKQGGHPGYDSLLAHLGSGWEGLVTDSPRPRSSSGNAEFYAVLYRPNRLSLCVGWNGLRYHQDNDGSLTGVGENRFVREPAYGCFFARSATGTVGCDFELAAYHATWADGNEDEIQAEVTHLQEVYQSMASAVSGEKDLYIIGDFNLTPDILADTVSAADRTNGTGSTLNSRGMRTSNLYGHLLVYDEDASQELQGNAEVIDVVSMSSSPKAFYKTVSDHLPIVVTMECGGADDD